MSCRPLHLLLLRHGETDSNAGGIIQGHLPVPLNDLGHRQARALADRLATYRPRIRRLISSDLRRAAQTAEPIAASLGLKIEYHAAWRERFLGEFQGKTVGERRTWSLASGEETPPGAESIDEFAARVSAALDAIDSPADGSPVAVVTHGGPGRVILRMLAEGRLRTEFPLNGHPELLKNCSIMEMHRGPGGTWRVGCVNDVSHLASLDNAAATDAG
jgi:broad specificity phosphatase PhoE